MNSSRVLKRVTKNWSYRKQKTRKTNSGLVATGCHEESTTESESQGTESEGEGGNAVDISELNEGNEKPPLTDAQRREEEEEEEAFRRLSQMAVKREPLPSELVDVVVMLGDLRAEAMDQYVQHDSFVIRVSTRDGKNVLLDMGSIRSILQHKKYAPDTKEIEMCIRRDRVETTSPVEE